MTAFVKNAWYVAAESHEVADDLLGRTICGDPVVLFRAEDGTPAALEDRCCHRHLPLSLGKRVGNRVQCGYHGLEFDASGACVAVPGQSRVPPGADIRAYRGPAAPAPAWRRCPSAPSRPATAPPARA